RHGSVARKSLRLLDSKRTTRDGLLFYSAEPSRRNRLADRALGSALRPARVAPLSGVAAFFTCVADQRAVGGRLVHSLGQNAPMSFLDDLVEARFHLHAELLQAL